MAQARLIYKKISISAEVNKLPLPARLLFTWLILHADDEGRLKGDPDFIKASIVPYTNWPLKHIEKYLGLMNSIGLIYYFKQNEQQYIEFPKWTVYQHIRKDRFTPSMLPSLFGYDDNQATTIRQPYDNQVTTQVNTNKDKLIKKNESEYIEDIAGISFNELATKQLALDNKVKNDEVKHNHKPSVTNKNEQSSTPDSNGESYEDPNKYHLNGPSEVGALSAWTKLEPDNPRAFYTTYLNAAHRGLPPSRFYIYSSEIKQSKADKPGAVFNSKVKAYFEKK
jgi:hypothetical protein